MIQVTKLISGGQTGADRSTEVADELGLERGGWAPAGWRSEDGHIPEKYRRGMKECFVYFYPTRTELNVKDSDGTLILSLGDLTHDTGSYLTAQLCRKHGRPYRHYKVDTLSPLLVQMARDWLAGNAIKTLNVAGPRESREPGVHEAAKRALLAILSPAYTP